MSKDFLRFALVALLVAAPITALSACGSSSNSTESTTDGDTTDGGTTDGGTTDGGTTDGGNTPAPTAVYSGTVYTDYTGSTPLSGATVTVTDSAGTHTATTGSDGNFSITSGVPGNDAKVTVNSKAMVGAVTSGNCATSNCHGSGTSPVWAN